MLRSIGMTDEQREAEFRQLKDEFRERAGKFVAVSDHEGLKKLFANYSAKAGMVKGEEGLRGMEEVLGEVFRLPIDQLKYGRFDHI